MVNSSGRHQQPDDGDEVGRGGQGGRAEGLGDRWPPRVASQLGHQVGAQGVDHVTSVNSPTGAEVGIGDDPVDLGRLSVDLAMPGRPRAL